MSESKVVSIHQPNFFPWLGYFFKIRSSDVFIVMDNVEYTSSGLTKRVFIRKSWDGDESGYLTVPITKVSNHTIIMDVKIKQGMDWVEQHLGKIRSVYKRAPFFTAYIHQIESVYAECISMTNLADVNMHIIRSMMELLQIDTPLHKASQMKASGSKANYVMELTLEAGGNVYLSGTGARKYQQESDFSDRGIRLIYNNFFAYTQAHPYQQDQGTAYLPGLSVLDALFNLGTSGIHLYLDEATKSMAW